MPSRDNDNSNTGFERGGAATVTAIIPNYNHADFVAASIRSLLEQTRPPDELIVIDDGSTDDSLKVIRLACENAPCARVLTNGENKGVAFTLNRGLREARGDYVFLGAADDRYLPNLIKHSMTVLARHPDAGLSCGNAVVVDDRDREIYRVEMGFADRPTCFSAAEVVGLLRDRNFIFLSPTVLLRRDAVLAAGAMDATLSWHCDWFLNFVVAFRHGICFVPENFATIRIAETTYSAQRHDWKFQSVIIRRIVERLQTSAFADVVSRFRAAAALPTFEFRALPMLAGASSLRQFLTPLLVWRLLVYRQLARAAAFLPTRVKYRLRRYFRL